jgi:hypothetical protein
MQARLIALMILAAASGAPILAPLGALAQAQQPPAATPTEPAPAPPPAPAPAPAPAAPAPDAPAAPPTESKEPPAAVNVLDRTATQGVLGREVRSKAGENMGRIVQVIVDRTNGLPRAAIIDFGGFLGVGSRRIAVAWSALQFASDQASERITLELTRDQVKDAPEYKEGKPIMALTKSGAPETIPDER